MRWVPDGLKQRLAIVAAACLVFAVAAFGIDRAIASPADRGDHDAVAGQDADANGVEPGDEDEKDGGPQEPADYLTLKWTSGQDVSQEQVTHAIKQAAAVPQGSGGSWSLDGPSNVGGRIVDLVVDPTHPDTVYTAASGGGVWKSTDAGMTWQSAWPTNVTQTIGALAIGSGRHTVGRYRRGQSVRRRPDVLRQWHLQVDRRRRDMAALGPRRQRGYRPHRRRPDRPEARLRRGGGLDLPVRVAARHLPGRQRRPGLEARPDAAERHDRRDRLAIDPANHNRVYAALWDHKRNNGARVYGGVGSGLFRSDDGGDTWTRLENIVGPVNDYDQTGTGLHADASLGRIGDRHRTVEP